jgi:carbon-monoxide dehydrogenase medium subunit
MLLREVEYAKPGSVAEALELLASNDGARALAGGQTLINVMKARAASPDMLVDLNGLEELRGIELAGDGTLTIGAMTTYSELMGSAEAKARPIAPRSRTSRCGTAARSAATSARTTRRTTCRR